MKRFKDLTGQRFGRLVAISPTDKRECKAVVWKCLCDCGNVVEVSSGHLHNGSKKSCGCLARDNCIKNGEKLSKDITGQRFGKLVAIRPTDKREDGSVVWECQ
ncbi:MAG: hypothetical protein FWC47_07910 [Oscillospiraceae bacterium]|nr:hypothetical protein [Oscillospiraceae bacterium]